MHRNSQQHQASDADEAEDRHDGQAPGASEQEPQQRAQDLAAVQGVDRQKVEDQQPEVDGHDRAQQAQHIRRRIKDPRESYQRAEQKQHGDQDHVHERSGRDTPEGRSRPLRRLYVSDTAQRPQHDTVGAPPTCRQAREWPNSCSRTIAKRATYSSTFQVNDV